MSRKQNLMQIISDYDAKVEKFEETIQEVQGNRNFSQEGQEKRVSEIRAMMRQTAEAARIAGVSITAAARQALNERIARRPADYQAQLANALTMAQYGAKRMTEADVKNLMTPFIYDKLAHTALKEIILTSGNQNSYAGIPDSDYEWVLGKLDEIELYLQKRVDRFGSGSAGGYPVNEKSENPFLNHDLYSIYIERCCDRLNADLTGAAEVAAD